MGQKNKKRLYMAFYVRSESNHHIALLLASKNADPIGRQSFRYHAINHIVVVNGVGAVEWQYEAKASAVHTA